MFYIYIYIPLKTDDTYLSEFQQIDYIKKY